MKSSSPGRGRWLRYRGALYWSPPPLPCDRSSKTSLWHRQRLTRLWGNSSFRTKLTMLLFGSALLQGFVVTQAMLYAIDQQLQVTAAQTLHRELIYFREVLDRRHADHADLAKSMTHDLENHVHLDDASSQWDSLELSHVFDRAHQTLEVNFYLITDTKGQVIAQRIYELTDDAQRSAQTGLTPAPLVSSNNYYRFLDVKPGADLSGLSMLRAAIARQQPMSGNEILDGPTLERLGLAAQTRITGSAMTRPMISSQAATPLTAAETSTYTSTQGLVLLAVQPIWSNNQLIGTVVVGTVANRNASLLNEMVTGRVDYAGLYMGDRLVTTNLPTEDGIARAIGLPALVSVTQPHSDLLRYRYRQQTMLTMYAPLYDYRHGLGTTDRSPIGLYSVSQSEDKVRSWLEQTVKLGYSVAASLFLGSIVLALILAHGLSKSLRQLTHFAQQIGSGETHARVKLKHRGDEIGILAQELNQMAEQIAFQIETIYWAEQQSRQQASELEKTLQRLRLTQSQLVQTEKMSSLGQLVAGVAHEINNPITFIHCNLSYVSDYTQELIDLLTQYQQVYPSPPQPLKARLAAADLEFMQTDLKKLLASMNYGSDRIRQIIQTLRNFARLDEMGIKAVDLHEGLDGALQFIDHRLGKIPGHPAIQVMKDYGILPQVQCYPGELNQVFMHLLTNALDALRSSSVCQPQIQITTRQLDPEWVQVTIADNGPGIAPEVQAKIFDPFFTTKPVGGGTGLGLTASYQIVVEQHHGKLICHSQVNQGTEFQLQLPVKQLTLEKLSLEKSDQA
ncbi:MAG: ATP-binding protein [Synechococcales bacterium]|nr:ATP-binding protein [Synechococcales bacterium]